MKQKVHKIQAESLEAAMSKVKSAFGPDVLILDVRERKEKRADSMGMNNIFEIRVAESDNESTTPPTERSFPPPGRNRINVPAGGEAAGKYSQERDNGKLEEELERIDHIINRVKSTKKQLAGVLQSGGNYPLADILTEAGASVRTITRLSHSLTSDDSSRRGDNFSKAVSHLRGYMNVVSADSWDDMAGMHLFMGSGGCGKTSLLVKLAGILAEQGKKIDVHPLFPRHNGEIERLKMVARTLGAGFKPLFNIEELKHLHDKSGENEVILVDSPCILSDRYLQDKGIRDCISKCDYIYKHFVFDLNASRVRLEREMELYSLLSFDFAVLTKFDMTWKKGRLLDLALAIPVVFSFINEVNHFDGGLDIATVPKLMMNISPRLLAEQGEDRNILVKNDSLSVEDNIRKSEDTPVEIAATE